MFPETNILKLTSGLSFGTITAIVGEGIPVDAAILKLFGMIDLIDKIFESELYIPSTVGSARAYIICKKFTIVSSV